MDPFQHWSTFGYREGRRGDWGDEDPWVGGAKTAGFGVNPNSMTVSTNGRGSVGELNSTVASTNRQISNSLAQLQAIDAGIQAQARADQARAQAAVNSYNPQYNVSWAPSPSALSPSHIYGPSW